MREINKVEYFNISEKGNYPKRCPLLKQCERRAFTLYLSDKSNFSKPFEEYKNSLVKSNDLEETLIPQKGESAERAGGHNNWGLSRICPEVSLFEPAVVPFSPRGLAVTSASYDKYFTNEDKTQIHDCGHFSECLEYIEYLEQRKKPIKEDIIDVKPNWFGIGINFNAIYRRYFKKEQ